MSEGLGRIALGPRPLADLAEAIGAARAEEACGVLLGLARGGAVIVDRVLPVRSSFAGPGGFAISDSELRRAGLAASRCDLEVVGIYHAHPGGSVALSPADLDGLARSPLPWLVVARDDSAGSLVVKVAAYAPWTGRPIVVDRAP